MYALKENRKSLNENGLSTFVFQKLFLKKKTTYRIIASFFSLNKHHTIIVIISELDFGSNVYNEHIG